MPCHFACHKVAVHIIRALSFLCSLFVQALCIAFQSQTMNNEYKKPITGRSGSRELQNEQKTVLVFTLYRKGTTWRPRRQVSPVTSSVHFWGLHLL